MKLFRALVAIAAGWLMLASAQAQLVDRGVTTASGKSWTTVIAPDINDDLARLYTMAPAVCGSVAGGPTNYTCTVSPAIGAKTVTPRLQVAPNVTNTGAVQINPNGTGLASVVKSGGVALVNGDFATGNIYELWWDAGNSRYQIIASIVGTANISDTAVTNAKLATMANATIKCRSTAGTGAPEDCTAAQIRTILNLIVGTTVQAWSAALDTWATKAAPSGVVVGTTDSQTLTGKTLTTPVLTLEQSAAPAQTAEGRLQWDTDDDDLVAGDGSATKRFLSSSKVLQAANNFSDLANAGTARTNLGLGALATKSAVASADITDATVANGDLANMANGTTKCRTTAGAGAPEDCTGSQATALLSAFTGDAGSGGVKGLVPPPASGDAAAGKVLGAGGAWVTPPGAGGGEANTASNVGTGGQGVFKQKSGVDLQFRNINAGSAKITVALDAGNNEVDIDAPDSSTTQAGACELATTAEAAAQTDTARCVTPQGLAFKPESFCFAMSDETTNITTGTAKIKFRLPYAFVITAVRASLSTAQTAGSIFTVDLNEGGSTILSTKLTIDNSETTSTTAATAAVISDTALADDAEISGDVDQVGTPLAKGLKVCIIGHQ